MSVVNADHLQQPLNIQDTLRGRLCTSIDKSVTGAAHPLLKRRIARQY